MRNTVKIIDTYLSLLTIYEMIHYMHTAVSNDMPSARIFSHFQDIAPKMRGPYLAMLYVSVLWTLLEPVVCQQLARAQFDQYHAVSTQAFSDMVAHNDERHMSHSNTTSECALFCSVLGRPRCLHSRWAW